MYFCSFGMAFIMMPMVTAALMRYRDDLPLMVMLSKYDASISRLYRYSNLSYCYDNTNNTTFISFWEELDKTNPVVQDHMRELASQYGGQEGAMKVLLQFVNKLATVEGIDAFIVATIFSIIALILCLFYKVIKSKATAQKLEAAQITIMNK